MERDKLAFLKGALTGDGKPMPYGIRTGPLRIS